MDDNELIIIKGVRGYKDINDIVYLNTEDVARGLGFTQTKNGIEYIRWERVLGYLKEFGFSTSGENGKTLEYIPENIFYKLCFKAENEVARKFQDIVTDEVLPSIRKNGGYIAGQKEMTNEEFLAKALLVAQNVIQEKEKENLQLSQAVLTLNKTVEEKENQVVIYKERSKYFEEIINQPDAMPLDDIMANFGLSAKRGNRILYIFGVIKDKGDWKITTKYSKLGITTRIPVKQVYDKFGNPRTIYHTYYNQRGRFFIYMILKNIGIKPSIESNASDEELALETIKEIDRIWKLSNTGKDTIYFKEIKDRIKEGFKLGVQEFVRNLKEGKLDELIGDDDCDVSEVNESDYDMIDFYDKDNDIARNIKARPWAYTKSEAFNLYNRGYLNGDEYSRIIDKCK